MMAFGNMLVEEAKDAHYTLKFNPRVIQDLEDEDDLDNVVSHSDDFANVGPHPTFPSSNASCDASPNTMMLSRGSGHTFKNADEFRNAIYQMSLAGRFQYKYKKNSPTHMSVKCSVEDCPWKMTAHAIEENEILRVYTYQVNHNHILKMSVQLRLKEINPGTIAEYTSHEDDGMFPLALGVVGSENYEDWYWFLENLKGILDDKWKSVVGPKTEEKLMSNITRSAPITVMPYLGGTFKVFTGDVYLVVDMQQHKCTCLTWQMSGLPCPHVCAVIRTLRHDVYDYIDPCFKVSTQHLIYSGQFQPLPTHNMPKVCEAGTLQDGQGNVFPSLQPPQVRRPPGRPRQRRIESQFSHKRAIHCSRCNGIVIILTMAGNGLDGSAASSLPLSAKTMSSRRREEGRGRDKERCSGRNGDGDGINANGYTKRYLTVSSTQPHLMSYPAGTSMFTRCSAARFKKLCNRLPEEKIQAIRDLQFGGLLNLNCTEPPCWPHFQPPNRRADFAGDLTSSEHPFGTIRACEEKLLDLPVGEEFRRAFIYYACATLLAPRLGSMVALHYVIKFQIPSIQVPITVPPALAWTDDLIKRRLVAEIKEFGAFGHAEIDFASQRSPTVERTMEPETNMDHDTNVDAENSDEIWHQYHDAERAINQYQRGIQQQLRIMCGLMHKLGTRRHSRVNSDAGDHVLDTPDRVVAPEYELQPNVPINYSKSRIVDGEEQPEGNVVPTNRNVRRRRVRQMAPNLLSPYISQPQTKQSAIKIDLKQAAALVFGEDLDASEELVSMHDTILTRGNLGCFEGMGG
ncbi:hypothetical protein CK203_111715 [Vitis vinifera]|uniref:SWIM-type domain-containing protein n=1 Tax=Vitis vinifera TaxID=29760 RepID=A0A438EMZ6_VITVI|nr:hypothetical protein CK203_111715 [Vitis vinifera]